ncbi:SGNH/GDSL hydrolase family protein [Scytonema sp. NUACC21]
MKKLFLVAGLAFLSSILVAIAAPMENSDMTQTSHQINKLYVFGDSLSDAGNVFQATGRAYPPNPPYFQGRYSNGLVWVEYLSSKLATSEQNTNLAYGGATTGTNGVNGIPGLLTQVYGFTKTNQQLSPNALYVLWAGANDYLYSGANPTVTVNNISAAIQSLSKAGAKKILVANLPDLGKLPATCNSGNASALSSLTTAHNLALAKSIEELNQKLGSKTQITILDTYSLYQEAIRKPEKFGLTNVTSACSNNYTVCDNPDKFLFWDGIHPTTMAHRILAEAALRALKTDIVLQQ